MQIFSAFFPLRVWVEIRICGILERSYRGRRSQRHSQQGLVVSLVWDKLWRISSTHYLCTLYLLVIGRETCICEKLYSYQMEGMSRLIFQSAKLANLLKLPKASESFCSISSAHFHLIFYISVLTNFAFAERLINVVIWTCEPISLPEVLPG